MLSKQTCIIFASGWHVRICKAPPPQQVFSLRSCNLCVQDFVQLKHLTQSLLSLVYLPDESLPCSKPLCCTASAPCVELSSSQGVSSIKLGPSPQQQLFVMHPSVFTKSVCPCTHTLSSLKLTKKNSIHIKHWHTTQKSLLSEFSSSFKWHALAN